MQKTSPYRQPVWGGRVLFSSIVTAHEKPYRCWKEHNILLLITVPQQSSPGLPPLRPRPMLIYTILLCASTVCDKQRICFNIFLVKAIQMGYNLIMPGL